MTILMISDEVLRSCATSRKVAVSSPDEVMEFGVYSAYNRNEYQKNLLR
jgi:hypothetical protein